MTQRLENMVEGSNRDSIRSKRKAISALFPFAVFLEQGGQRGMIDAISRVATASDSGSFMWYHAKPFVTAMFDKSNPPSLNWVLRLISPCLHWHDGRRGEDAITIRATIASAISRTGEVGQDTIDRLLRIAFLGFPRPPYGSSGQQIGTGEEVRQVRALGDIGILKSYLLLVWSEWGSIDDQFGGFAEMQTSIREDFRGIRSGGHRDDLIKRLDHIIQKLNLAHNPGFGLDDYMRTVQRAMRRYTGLKRVVLEVDGEAMSELTRTSTRLIPLNLLTLTNVYRIAHDIHVCFTSRVTVVSHL